MKSNVSILRTTWIKSITILALCWLWVPFVHSKPIKICLDQANWIPFIYTENDQLKGIHITIIKSSLDSLGMKYSFHKVPWKRCLKGLEKGTYDAVATASYNQERSQYLWYPSDASNSHQSHWRVSQVEYIITTTSDSDFIYNNDPLTIPQPIRVPRGYSIANDLRALGVDVDDSSINDIQNIKRLLREETGSVITLPSLIFWLNKQPMYKDKLKADPTLLKSKSYFFAISKAGALNKEQAEIIWQMIVKQRNNEMSTTHNAQQ